MRKLFITVFILLVLFWAIYGKQESRSYELENLLNPFFMRVDKSQLYISQGPEILIYSLSDYKLKKRLGKSGEGPGEFRVSPTQNLGSLLFDVTDEKIIVYSIGKTSFFKKDGSFIQEMRSTRFGLKTIGDNFVGYGFLQDKGIPFTTISMYNSDGEIIKEFHREKAFSINQSQINLFDMRSSFFMVANEKIFVERDKNRIDIFDKDGSLLSSIVPEIAQVPVSKETKAGFRLYLETDPQFKAFYPVIRDRLFIPNKYPSICLFDVVKDRIFIMTFYENDRGRKVLEYSISGRMIHTHIINGFYSALFLPLPYAFDTNHFYQLHENDEEEIWELKITSLRM